ncbi:MAG: sugar ABC transporter permease [Lachnospiraceae bacterium]|jgi:multiple sugar transport system permease protein|nr:sugar ABC transporter permease [Lachnospiraceae bacterium]
MSLANWKSNKKRQAHFLWKDIKDHKTCYLFLLPYAIVFTLFFIAPVIVSIWYSFTYFNVLQPARFIGFQNYINLILADDIFLTSVKNTFLIAAITGPVGYIMAFIFAWLIHELPRSIRAIAVLVFYAPTISGQVYLIWSIIFSGDAYGYFNSYMVEWGFLDNPVLWLTDPRYMLIIVIVVQLWLSLGAGFLSFIAGLNTIPADQYEAGYVDGIRNRWQELWYITLPNMKSMLMFGAVMAISQSFNTADVSMQLCGFPSTDYAAHTVVCHLIDYGSYRFEMGYASAVATVLFAVMYLCNKFIQKALMRLGT